MASASGAALRLAKPQDAQALPAIEEAAGQMFAGIAGYTAVAANKPISAPRHRALIAKRHCLVAADGQRIAGFITCEPMRHELHIWELSVHPDYQRQGLGERLLRGVVIDAGNQGFSALTLTTFRDIPWNAPFYTRLGFVEVEDAESHPRLADLLDKEAKAGSAYDSRIAMIRFLS